MAEARVLYGSQGGSRFCMAEAQRDQPKNKKKEN